MAVQWLPFSMGTVPLDARCRPSYTPLAARRAPLIIHGGDQHAVPGMKQQLGNPLHFDLVLKRRLSWQGQRFGNAVFETRAAFVSDAAAA